MRPANSNQLTSTVENKRKLYVITDPELCADQDIEKKVEQALAGGADWVQYRDKRNLSFQQKVNICGPLKRLCEDYRAELIINDDAQLASHFTTSLHLGQTDLIKHKHQLDQLKHLAFGVTCHNQLDLAEVAIQHHARYISFGAFFNSKTKPQATKCSLSVLQEARKRFSCQDIVAIGGISLENMHLVIQAGANIVSLCHNIWSAPDIEKECLAFKDALNKIPFASKSTPSIA